MTTERQAGCDGCDWEGEFSRSAKAHHETTGHTTWARTLTTTFYGNPVGQWAAVQGLTVTRVEGEAEATENEKEDRNAV